ncbi:hypothetical protein [Brevibacterium sp.]|uniref:hypothetical protein n=1 Tax=Brevibacterium sp. TaxID=1701 RepID=UPI002811C79E|nr:hypothetical protein [Brevibacterium sp.]
MTVDPDDSALDDDRVAQFCWFHTSTQQDWPTWDFDPAADLTCETRMMMGRDEWVAGWVDRQRAKALHVGTYERAVDDRPRRMRDQADRGNQFCLYRVHLEPTVVVREDWLVDLSDFVGDVVFDEVCPASVDVSRCLNY